MIQTAAPALRAREERLIVGAFRNRGALTGATAQPLLELGLLNSRALRAMVSDTVVRRAGPNRYFLDERVWATRRRMGWGNVVRVMVVVALALAATAAYLAGR